MVAVEVVAYVGVDACPGFEGLELGFRLGHVGVEVVEVSELLCFEAGVCVGWIEALMMLDIYEYTVFLCCLQQGKVVFEGLNSGLGDHNVNLSFNCVESNWVMGCIWRENGDCVTWRKSVDRSLVGIGVSDIIRRI